MAKQYKYDISKVLEGLKPDIQENPIQNAMELSDNIQTSLGEEQSFGTSLRKVSQKTLDLLNKPIEVSPKVEQGLRQLATSVNPVSGMPTSLSGIFNTAVGIGETVISPVSKIFGLATQELDAAQKGITELVGLENQKTVGSLMDDVFIVSAEAPLEGAKLLDAGLERLGIPKGALDLGLPENVKNELTQAIGGASSFLSQLIVAKGLEAVKTGLRGQEFKPLTEMTTSEKVQNIRDFKAEDIELPQNKINIEGVKEGKFTQFNFDTPNSSGIKEAVKLHREGKSNKEIQTELGIPEGEFHGNISDNITQRVVVEGVMERTGKLKGLDPETRELKIDKRVSELNSKLKDVESNRQEVQTSFATGIKNELVNKERESRGLNPFPEGSITGEIRNRDLVMEEATQKIQSGEINPRKPFDVINNENLRGDTKEAILLYDKAVLKNDINTLQKDINLETNPEIKAQKIAERTRLDEAYNENEIASKKLGTETARSLGFRRNLIKEDYSYASIIQQGRNAKNGKALTPKEQVSLETKANKISEYEQKIQELESKNSKLEADLAFKKIERETKLEQRKTKRSVKAEDLEVEYDSLIKEFVKTQSLNVGFNTQQIALMTKMTKNRILKGANTIEGIVDEIYVSLANQIEGVTKRDIRDAISGYGKFAEPTKNELQTRLNDIKRQGKLLSTIEDLEAGKQIPGIKKENLKSSERVQSLEKKLGEVEEKTGIADERRTERYKTRLKSEIERLQEQLKSGNFSKEKKKTALDLEARKLAEQRDIEKAKVDAEINRINRENMPNSQKRFETALDIIHATKSTVSGGEFSQVWRQGAVYALNPLYFKKVYGKGGAFREQFKYFKSESAHRQLIEDIKNDPDALIMKEMGIDFTTPEGIKIGKKRVDEFQSRLNLPWAKPFERSFTGFLDKLKFDIGKDVIKEFEKAGLDPKLDAEIYKAQGSWINNATGRGNFRNKQLQAMFEQATPVLGIPFFSPRLIVSRMQLLNPLYYASLPRPVRIRAMKDMLGYIGTGASLLAIAKAAGADVELDPRSSDFLKVKIGNTRIDPWGGFQQFAVLGSRLNLNMFNKIFGRKIPEVKQISGGFRSLEANKFPFLDPWDEVTNFGENKMSPTFQIIKGVLSGTEWGSKEPYGIDDAALNALVPLYIRDLYQATQEDGIEGVLKASPGLFGAGVGTYKPRKKKVENPLKEL